MNKSLKVFLFVTTAAHLAFATPAITGVTAQQRYPWNGKVDISYTVSGDISNTAKQDGLIPSFIKVSAMDGMTGISYTATSFSGDSGLTEGTHNLVWDMITDGVDLLSSNVVFSVSCEMRPATYCVIDLSSGSEASSYPVTYLTEPPYGGFNVNEYKNAKLVLRRIEPGTFMMDGQYETTLTRPYYMGIFEVTQRQYELVMGSNPSKYTGDMCPVERVSYNVVRGSNLGAQWPASSGVDANSFMGKLQSRTGIGFDLPTEAQWEYACRAGTTSIYNNGGDTESDLNLLGLYSGNLSSIYPNPTMVGRYQSNAWGLYDMHGNVSEWCLDWYASSLSGGINPKGSSSGEGRVIRGGSWRDGSQSCSSSSRRSLSPSAGTSYIGFFGFRLARTLTATSQTTYAGSSAPTIVGSFSRPEISPITSIVSWPLSVTISCATEGAEIHYTTDGSVPTAQSTIYRRFRITERTTVKAIAVKNGVVSEVAVAEYATGQSAAPIITPADGTTFNWSGQTVSIAWEADETDNGVLRYTTDGSDPTADSPIYSGSFTIDDSTVVKAKAFGDQFFDSAVVTANLTRVWVDVATPAIAAAASFTGSKTKVSLSCATEGVVIRYTLNGNDPNSHSTRYTGPFFVTNSCTVKAYATCADYHDSAVASFAIEKIWGIGDTLGVPDHAFTTGGDLPFVRVTDATAPLGESMKSGAITHNQTSTLSTTVTGPGTVSFQWKTSCEDSGGAYDWDHAEFKVDGVAVAKLDGETAWQTVTHDIAGDGTHTFEWRYIKDDVESEGEDCCWVADFCWTSAVSETQTTPEPVPYSWLSSDAATILAANSGDYEAAANATAANGVNKVWECYVAGISPTNATQVFRTVILWENGEPKISWEPKLAAEEESKRVYTEIGKTNLIDNGWTEVSPTNRDGMRFFKVKVEMRQ